MFKRGKLLVRFCESRVLLWGGLEFELHDCCVVCSADCKAFKLVKGDRQIRWDRTQLANFALETAKQLEHLIYWNKYILLVWWVQNLNLNHQRSARQKIHWNVTLEKHRFLNFMRLLCEFRIKDFRVIWLTVVIDHWLNFWMIGNRGLSFNRFAWKTWLTKRVELVWRQVRILSMSEMHIAHVSVVRRRWWYHFIFSLLFDI